MSDQIGASRKSAPRGRQPETTASETACCGFPAFEVWPSGGIFLAVLFAVVLSQPAAAQKTGTAPKKRAPVKRSAVASSTSKKSSAKTTSKGQATARKRSAGKRKSAAEPVRRQLHPTPERYSQIQTALANAGYFDGPANGVWGASSIAALQKFQSDNGLEPSGRIDALSLIRLNLGPKYEDNTDSAAIPAANDLVTRDK